MKNACNRLRCATMDYAAINDITDVQTLCAMLVDFGVVIAARDHTIAFRDAKISKLTHEIARLCRSSSRPSPGV